MQRIVLPQISNCLDGFCFRRMRNGSRWTLRIAARAQDNAVVWVFRDDQRFAFFFLESVNAKCAVVYAFPTAQALFIVNFRSPRYFDPRDSMICFFSHVHFVLRFVVFRQVSITIFKYCYGLKDEAMSRRAETQIRFKSAVLHALADEVRLEILSFLRDGEKCVCEIVPHLDLIQPVVSRHLKMLKDAGIVRCRKDGTKRMYSVVDARIYNVIDNLTPALIGVLTKQVLNNVTCP